MEPSSNSPSHYTRPIVFAIFLHYLKGKEKSIQMKTVGKNMPVLALFCCHFVYCPVLTLCCVGGGTGGGRIILYYFIPPPLSDELLHYFLKA